MSLLDESEMEIDESLQGMYSKSLVSHINESLLTEASRGSASLNFELKLIITNRPFVVRLCDYTLSAN